MMMAMTPNGYINPQQLQQQQQQYDDHNNNNNININVNNSNNISYPNNNMYLIQTVPTMSETFDHMIETPHNDFILQNNLQSQQQYNDQYNQFSTYQTQNEYNIKLQSYNDYQNEYNNNNSYQDTYSQQEPSPPETIYGTYQNNPNYINQQINSNGLPSPNDNSGSINNKKRSLENSSSSIYLIPSTQQNQYFSQCPNSPNSSSSSSSNSYCYQSYRVISQPPSPPSIHFTYNTNNNNINNINNNTSINNEASDEELEEQFKEFLTPTLNLIESNHKENLLALINDYLYEELPLKSLLVELRDIQMQNNNNSTLLNHLLELFLILDNSSNIMVNFLKENGIEDSELIIDQNKFSILFNGFENGLRGKDKSIKKTISRGLRNPPNKWTKDESSKLITLVHENGDKQWKKIALQIGGGKTGAQCAQHWKRVLCPAIRKGSWDEEEEAKLFMLVEKHGQSWKNVASEIRTRTDIQCRYQYFKSCMSREVPWSQKEDEILQKKVLESKQENKEIGWMDLSKSMARARQTKIPRTALECKLRWNLIIENNSRIF